MWGDYLSAMYRSYQQPQINYNMRGDYLSAMYKVISTATNQLQHVG